MMTIIGLFIGGLLLFTIPIQRIYMHMTTSHNTSLDASPQNDHTTTPYFPEVSGFNLSGDEFNLPGNFEKPYNIVMIAYTQQQQYDVYTWLPLLEDIESDFENVRYYELPTLPRYNPLFRAQIDAWMIAGIPSEDTRSRTITLYLDVDAFNEAIQVPNIRQMRILLVTPEGEILWQDVGSYTTEKGDELYRLIAELESGSTEE